MSVMVNGRRVKVTELLVFALVLFIVFGEMPREGMTETSW
jgi:hypothetical protein